MALPVGLYALSWFFPFGKTAAYSLTQDLPAEGDAIVLSLACGDIRNLLFTSYLEPNRNIDLTCVDHDASLIARNILMLSLILDGKDNWEMYHHTKISAESLEIIKTQAEVLQKVTKWDRRVQFLDDSTMKEVKEIWKHYKDGPDLRLSAEFRKKFGRKDGSDCGGSQSAAPYMFVAPPDMRGLQTKFWKDGTVIGTAEYPNPLFFSPSVMDFSANPLAGFHLALGYAPVMDNIKGSIAAAQAEFTCWTQAFRNSQMIVKYCWADALSFCHATGGLRSYRDSYSTTQLILETQAFDVIDTNNVADHLSIMNLMVVSSPILKPNGYLRMSLITLKQKPKTILDRLLGGDLFAVSSLLGLSLVEHATDASAVCAIDLPYLQTITKTGKMGSRSMGESSFRFTWKTVPAIMLDAEELSEVLYTVYQFMFEAESKSKKDSPAIKERLSQCPDYPHPYFHRGSFAHLLRAVQKNSEDWEVTITKLLRLIQSDQDISLTRPYMQELYVYLHLFGLFTAEAIKNPLRAQLGPMDVQQSWSSLPSIMWLTVKVPRLNLQDLISLGAKLESVAVRGIVKASNEEEHDFASIQMIFGEGYTTGYMDTLSVHINEDSRGVMGTAPLFVSFRVPSSILTFNAKKTMVGFGLQPTSNTLRIVAGRLERGLKIFMTNLEDSASVFISKAPPNNAGNESVIPTRPTRLDSNIKGTVFKNKLRTITARINIEHDSEKMALLAGAKVTLHQFTPWEFELELAGYKYRIELPVSVSATRCKIRIARKSAYLELVAPPLSAEDRLSMPPFPLSVTEAGIRLLNMPRVALNVLPILDVQREMDWLVIHLSTSQSASERLLCKPGVEKHADTRLVFKLSLNSMYTYFSGLQSNNPTVQVFEFIDKATQGIAMVICANKLHLDLSNQTVLMDVAILPVFEPAAMRIYGTLASDASRPRGQIYASGAGIEMWKQAIPAYIERCRSWSHRDTCEYRQVGKVPLSYELNEHFFCTCGNGIFPKDYLQTIPEWPELARYCTRAAISPCFAVPYADEAFEDKLEIHRKTCHYCSKTHNSPEDLKQCGGCHEARYCSKECQKKHWPQHKLVCRR